MGSAVSCVDAEFIIKAGKKILDEFFSKSLFRQAYSVVSSDNNCEEPTHSAKEVQDYLKCQFLRGQKAAWEWIIILIICLGMCSIILSIILWRKTSTVITQVRHVFVSRNHNYMIANSSNPPIEMVRSSNNPSIEKGKPTNQPKKNKSNVVVSMDDIQNARREQDNEW